MLKKTTPELQNTVQRVNAAAWHSSLAALYYFKWQGLLDGDGLLHPSNLPEMKYFRGRYRYHAAMSDGLLRTRPMPKTTVSQLPVDTSKFADDFERALIQRGNAAKQASRMEQN